MNFYDLLKARAAALGDKIFLHVDGQSLSYADFLRAVDGAILLIHLLAALKDGLSLMSIAGAGGTGDAVLIEA